MTHCFFKQTRKENFCSYTDRCIFNFLLISPFRPLFKYSYRQKVRHCIRNKRILSKKELIKAKANLIGKSQAAYHSSIEHLSSNQIERIEWKCTFRKNFRIDLFHV